MENNEIMEGNKLIAEFMEWSIEKGMEKEPNPFYNQKYEAGIIPKMILLSDFRFRTSWDWIMPAVEKIAKMGHIIELTFTQVDTSAHIRGDDPLHCPYYSKSIDAVYTLCVQFIKWYNSTLQPQPKGE